MRTFGKIWLGLLTACWCHSTALADEHSSLIEQLARTRVSNLETILAAQFQSPTSVKGFLTADPYHVTAAATANKWFSDAETRQMVCAIRFRDADRVGYELSDFNSAAAALSAGFMVTHYGRCGTCSPLGDLAVYLATPDLTTPARQCARKFGLERKKRCFQQTIGFSEYCAESWAYNAQHTRQQCLGACISDYGLINLILNRYPGGNTDESGKLRPCLQCDEDHSGPGFQYSAGRTRRNSGIVSAIRRKPDEIRILDHTEYFGSKPPQ